MLVVPSDHEITTEADFWRTVEDGVPAAASGSIVVFGIRPTRPETGYGYIEVAAGNGVRDVSRFVEKPDLPTAEQYLARRQFLLEHRHLPVPRQRHARRVPEIQPGNLERLRTRLRGRDRRPVRRLHCRSISMRTSVDSIDYAIMEKAATGSRWCRRRSAGATSARGSRCSMSVPPTRRATSSSATSSPSTARTPTCSGNGALLSAIGLQDVAIVSTLDATFVAPVSHSQNVKKIVEQLEKSGRLGDALHALRPTASTSAAHGAAACIAGCSRRPCRCGRPSRRRRCAWRLPRSARLRWRAVARSRSASAPGPAGLCLRRRQGARLGQAGRQPHRAWARLHSAARAAPIAAAGCARSTSTAAWPTRPRMPTTSPACSSRSPWRMPAAIRMPSGWAKAFAFLDEYLEDSAAGGFFETPAGAMPRRSSPHMPLLEAFLAWHTATGDRDYPARGLAHRRGCSGRISSMSKAGRWANSSTRLAAGSRRQRQLDRARSPFRMGLAAGRLRRASSGVSWPNGCARKL